MVGAGPSLDHQGYHQRHGGGTSELGRHGGTSRLTELNPLLTFDGRRAMAINIHQGTLPLPGVFVWFRLWPGIKGHGREH